MADSVIPIAVRWAGEHDTSLSLVFKAIPASVVDARIKARQIAIAERSGQALGALQLEYLWGTRPYIAMIRVAAEHHRCGVGRALLTFVEAGVLRGVNDGNIDEILFRKTLVTFGRPTPQA
jgi:hypothetical protein